MEDVINLSSDDEDNKNDEHDALKIFLSNIMKKYSLPESPKNEIEFDKNPVDEVNLNTQKKYNDISPSSSDHDDHPIIETISNKQKRIRKSADDPDKLLEKMRIQQEKLKKKEERERIKAENIANKAKKQALATAYKNLKPEECLKFITTIIDINLLNSEIGSEILTSLTALGVNFKTASQTLSNTVTWNRQIQSQLTDLERCLGLSKEKSSCDELICIFTWDEIVTHVHERNLYEFFVTKQSLVPDNKITIGIYGLQNYFKYHKNRNGKHKNRSDYASAPIVNRKQVDAALTEIQIMTGCSHRLLETPQDVGNMIAQFSKSIAQLPYKLEKQAKSDEMEWYVAGCNKDSVRVDKSGNGLFSLWRQQLTQFSLARLETADAICSQYPSPSLLMEAYDECVLQKEKEDLLKDIPIRRSAGPLNNVRKLGPELSKKMCTVFTSRDGHVVV